MVNINVSLNSPAGASPSTGSLLGKILIALFLTPFAAVGLFTGYLAFRKISNGTWEDVAMLLVFAIVFGGVGFGGMAAVYLLSKKSRKADARKAAYPGQPWMWRDDWATGIIRSTAKTQIMFFVVFTVLWNLISMPLVYFLPTEVFEKGNTAALLGFLFPLVGIGLAIATVRMILARRKYGETIFRMSATPGVVGGTVAGTIDVGRELAGALKVRLCNVRRVTTGSGKNSSTNETLLWEDERTIAQGGPMAERAGESFAVRFEVPYECAETDQRDTRDETIWRLEASSEEEGIDFSATFDVPVFKTASSSPALTEAKVERETAGVVRDGPPEAPPGFEVRPGAEGGTEFVLRAVPSLKGSLGLGVFMLFWTGIVVVLVMVEAPVIFPIVFGLFDILFLGALATMNFLIDTVVVSSEAVSVRHKILAYEGGVRIPRSTITRVKLTNPTQSTAKSSWTVMVEQTGGPGARLWKTFDERRHAEYVVEALRRELGLTSKE